MRQVNIKPVSEDEIHRNYRYSAYITNQEQSATDVWRTLPKQRRCRESNQGIKRQILEPKVLTLKAFFPTEAALIFSMIAYNLMSIFRLFVLQEKRRKHYLHYDIEPLLLELILKK